MEIPTEASASPVSPERDESKNIWLSAIRDIRKEFPQVSYAELTKDMLNLKSASVSLKAKDRFDEAIRVTERLARLEIS